MEIELKSEASNKRLNNAVAITVVILSVLMAVSKIKDDNIVQAMQAAKADSVDIWNEYQAERMKLHLNEQTKAIATTQNEKSADNTTLIASLDDKIAKYNAASVDLQKRATELQNTYDGLNFRDDQFDVADAGFTIALSLSAVAALTELWWLLAVSWGFGLCGLIMAVAAFNAWPIHPDWLVAFLN